MIYTLRQGKQGWKLPHRYTLDKGSRVHMVPSVVTGSLPFNEANLEKAAKYAAVPMISVVVLAFLQFNPNSQQATPRHAPTAPGQASSTGVVQITPTARTTASANSANQGVWSIKNAGSSATASSSTQTIDTDSSSLPLTVDNTGATTITGGPVSIDPITPSGSTDPSTGSTDPTPPVQTDPSFGSIDTGTTGAAATTTIAQVGVDVFPPSINLGL